MGIQNAAQLEEAIALLEIREQQKKAAMVEQYHETLESLKPVNLIKSAYHRVADTPNLAGKLIGSSVGLGVGILSKRLLFGRSTNIIKRVLGMALELTVANTVAKNSEMLRQKGTQLIKKVIKHRD